MSDAKIIKCDAFSEQRCRSCTLIENEYNEGLKTKIEMIENNSALSFNSKCLETSSLQGYRNKSKFIISGTLDFPIIGIPSPSNKYEFNELLDCPINDVDLNMVCLEIKNRIKKYLLTPYDLKTKKGEFKYLILNKGFKTKEISIRFGMRSSEALPRVKKLLLELRELFPLIKVASFEIQPKHAAIFSGEIIYLTDTKYIKNHFEKYTLLSSVENFFQVNSEVTQKLYGEIGNYFKNIKIGNTLDLFCGVGGFSYEASSFSERVIGIELSQIAIDCANESLKYNTKSNIKFICDDAFNFNNYIDDKVDLIIVNPPRRGIGEKFCRLILEINPEYLIYSSCNPETLKRDSIILSEKYSPVVIKAVDMFALTNHLEVLTIWKRAF